MSDDLRELAKLDYEASIKEAADRLHFQQEIGLTACKSGILVNGGAIIGLLTFIGNQPAIKNANGLKFAMETFALGILGALLSLYCAYMGQELLSNYRVSAAWISQQDMKGEPRMHDTERERGRGKTLMIAGSASVLFSIAMFIYGAITAANAIL